MTKTIHQVIKNKENSIIFKKLNQRDNKNKDKWIEKIKKNN